MIFNSAREADLSNGKYERNSAHYKCMYRTRTFSATTLNKASIVVAELESTRGKSIIVNAIAL